MLINIRSGLPGLFCLILSENVQNFVEMKKMSLLIGVGTMGAVGAAATTISAANTTGKC